MNYDHTQKLRNWYELFLKFHYFAFALRKSLLTKAHRVILQCYKETKCCRPKIVYS